MARVHTAKAKTAGKKCGRCQKTIEKGESFYWAMPGFRSSWKSRKINCMAHPFRQSELTQSLRGDAYAAIEAAEDELNALDKYSVDDEAEIQGILETAAESIGEVRDAYEEAAENFGGGGPSGEARDEMDDAISELEGVNLDSFNEEGCEAHNDDFKEDCDDCKELKADWAQEQIDLALEAVSSLSI